jgi:hypothetical protein
MCPQLGTHAVGQPMGPGVALGVSRFHGGLQRRCRIVKCRVWVVDVAGCETLICASRSLGARSGGGPDMQWVGRTVRCRGTCREVERWLLADHTAESRLPRKHNTYSRHVTWMM